MSSQLSVLSKNTLLHFHLLFQFCRSLRNISLGDCILGKSNVIITVGWLWWRHQSPNFLVLPRAPPNPKPTTGSNASRTTITISRLSDLLFFSQCAYRYTHGGPQKFLQGGTKSTFCLSFSVCWRCNANGRTQTRKCPILRQQLHTVFSL